MNLFLRVNSNVERAIPVIIMAALAMTSLSLLRSSPSYTAAPINTPQAQLDYYLQQFSTAHINDSGKLKSFVRGSFAQHSQVNSTTAVQDFLFASTGKNNLYLGGAAYADIHDNANDLILKKNAVINRISTNKEVEPTQSHLKSAHLRISQYPEIVISDTFVRIEQGEKTITAQSMQYDGDKQEMSLQGAVKIRNNKQ